MVKNHVLKNLIQQKLLQGLEAIFVELGSSRHGFLPFKELSPEYFDSSKTGSDRFKISEGDEIVVQIEKEERTNKGAAAPLLVRSSFSICTTISSPSEILNLSEPVLDESKYSGESSLNGKKPCLEEPNSTKIASRP